MSWTLKVLNAEAALESDHVHPISWGWPAGCPFLFLRCSNSFAMNARAGPRFFVYDIRHPGDVAAVVPLKDVHESLNAAASHALLRIGGEARNASGAGKVMKKAAAVFDLRIE